MIPTIFNVLTYSILPILAPSCAVLPPKSCKKSCKTHGKASGIEPITEVSKAFPVNPFGDRKKGHAQNTHKIKE